MVHMLERGGEELPGFEPCQESRVRRVDRLEKPQSGSGNGAKERNREAGLHAEMAGGAKIAVRERGWSLVRHAGTL